MTRGRFTLAVLFLALSIALGGILLRRFLEGLPSFQTLEDYTPSLTTRVFDAKGELLAELSI